MRDRPLSDDDLALFFLMHRAIRSDLDAFATTVETLDPADPARLAEVSRWLGFLDRAITAHHEGEDEWLYPLLATRDAAFADARAGLEADHQGLDPALRDLRSRLDGMTTAADRAALAAAARRLADDMAAHLDREEAVMVPAMRSCVSYREIKEFEKASARKGSLRDLALVLPWVASAATPRELTMIQEILPWPVRLLYRWRWQPSYERLQRTLRAAA